MKKTRWPPLVAINVMGGDVNWGLDHVPRNILCEFEKDPLKTRGVEQKQEKQKWPASDKNGIAEAHKTNLCCGLGTREI